MSEEPVVEGDYTLEQRRIGLKEKRRQALLRQARREQLRQLKEMTHEERTRQGLDSDGQ